MISFLQSLELQLRKTMFFVKQSRDTKRDWGLNL